MRHGRVGASSSVLARAMGTRPLTNTQRALLVQYRQHEAELLRAQAAVHSAMIETEKALALMRRAGVEYGRILEVTAYPFSLTKLRLAIERGAEMLGQDPASDAVWPPTPRGASC